MNRSNSSATEGDDSASRKARPTVAVLGASADRSKFGNKAVRAHLRAGYRVFPVNPRGGTIEGVPAYRSLEELPVERLDRVTLYVPPEVGLRLLEAIARKKPREVWVNPGADSPELLEAAEKLGLNVIRACSIVGVGVDPATLDE